MADQPSYRPLQPSDFFSDGRSARPLEPGTVARGQLHDDRHLHTGMRDENPMPMLPAGPTPLNALAGLVTRQDVVSRYHSTFPMPVSRELLARGRERYNIFCSVCHDRLGNGEGMIVKRGFTKPPSFHTDDSRGLAYQGVKISLRDVPPGYVFSVISHGYGAMPDHAAQVPEQDRWAIAAYIRALQLSRYVPASDLAKEDQARLVSEEVKP